MILIAISIILAALILADKPSSRGGYQPRGGSYIPRCGPTIGTGGRLLPTGGSGARPPVPPIDA